MSDKRRYRLFFLSILGIPLVLFGSWLLVDRYQAPPILGPTTTNADGETVQHVVAPFETIDQLGRTVTNDALAGSPYVASFFFTSCPVICPEMTVAIKEVQDSYAADDLSFVSFSIDPERDTIARLKAFAERFEVSHDNWHFVRADKDDIYRWARNEFMLTAIEGTAENNDFIHSELVALVDADGHVRGFYDPTDASRRKELMRDIDLLLERSTPQNSPS